MDVAVDERYPGPGVVGVAAVGFVEDPRDDGGGVLLDAGDEPLVGGGGPFLGGLPFGVVGGEDVAGRAGHGGRVVDRAQLGHAFAVALLAFG